VDNFISELGEDCAKDPKDNERGVVDCDARKSKEIKLYQLLSELIETEKKYVSDLEQVCVDYLPLVEISSSSTLDRKTLNKIKRQTSINQICSESLKKNFSCEDFESFTLGLDHLRPSRHEIRQVLGNIEDIKEYHKNVLLPKIEEAFADAQLMRTLFKEEQPRMCSKYGRYGINHTRSSNIIDHNIKFFSLYQINRGLSLRIDAMLIKPIQRITKYHMFLKSIFKTCKELGFVQTSFDFAGACDTVMSIASNTNTMMWVGNIENCPLDLVGQGQLLKHGPVEARHWTEGGRKGRKWSRSDKPTSSYLVLFQQAVVLCGTSDKSEDKTYPQLQYIGHLSINQIRVRDTTGENLNTFEIHKLEELKAGASLFGEGENNSKSAVIMRIECKSEKDKDNWVKNINKEVKQLRTMARTLSSHKFMWQ